jgi:hypothetical protein
MRILQFLIKKKCAAVESKAYAITNCYHTQKLKMMHVIDDPVKKHPFYIKILIVISPAFVTYTSK